MTRSVPLPTEPTDTDSGPAAGRGAPGRVAEVHAQTRRGLMVAAGFAVAAVATIVARTGWWIAITLQTYSHVLPIMYDNAAVTVAALFMPHR